MKVNIDSKIQSSADSIYFFLNFISSSISGLKVKNIIKFRVNINFKCKYVNENKNKKIFKYLYIFFLIKYLYFFLNNKKNCL